MKVQVHIKLLDERLNEHMPHYATYGAAAIDLRACREIIGASTKPIYGSTTIGSGEVIKVGTGLSIHLASTEIYGERANVDPNFSVASMILPRSGLGANNGIVIGNLVGLIDSDYQGELIACLWNRSNVPFTFQPLDRIAQMMIIPVLKPEFVAVEEFGEQTERGAGGFGSTGR